MPDELANMPDCPPGFEYLWEWFLTLNGKRQNGMSVNPISELEIEAFFRNRRITPKVWEVNLISRLDAIAVEVFGSDKSQKES